MGGWREDGREGEGKDGREGRMGGREGWEGRMRGRGGEDGTGGWEGGEDGREATTHGLSYTQTLPKVMTQGTELLEGGRCNEDGSVRCMHACRIYIGTVQN